MTKMTKAILLLIPGAAALLIGWAWQEVTVTEYAMAHPGLTLFTLVVYGFTKLWAWATAWTKEPFTVLLVLLLIIYYGVRRIGDKVAEQTSVLREVIDVLERGFPELEDE